jgi:hypothetical protein
LWPPSRALPPNDRAQRFVIFVREQQQMARLQTQGAATESALDLSAYVEFNRNYK